MEYGHDRSLVNVTRQSQWCKTDNITALSGLDIHWLMSQFNVILVRVLNSIRVFCVFFKEVNNSHDTRAIQTKRHEIHV